MSNLHYISAVDAIKQFQTKKLSPVELMKAIIARAEAVEPEVNALVMTAYDEALAQAKEAEARYMNGTARPLEGIPCAVKEEMFIAGQPTPNGSLLFQNFVPDRTALIVERLLDAGVIVHARSTTPEFSITPYCWTELWGVTRNPWNLAITPGGSSGGSGASLATGTTTLATGSDIGGSIRIPASLCGVVGYKPPYGRNPDLAPYGLEYACHVGGLARNTADMILMQNIMSGPHPHDIATIKPKLTIPSTFEGVEGWRIAYSLDLGYFKVDESVRRNTLASMDVFRSLGATVEEVEIGWTTDVLDAFLHHLGNGITSAQLAAGYDSDQRHLMTNYAQVVTMALANVTPMQFGQSQIKIGEMYEQMSDIFAHYDLFVCPTLSGTGVAADIYRGMSVEEVLADPKHTQTDWTMTYPFNLLSRLPVLSIPSGKADNGVPTGMQLIAPTFEDAIVFQAAMAYEKATSNVFIGEENQPMQMNTEVRIIQRI